jgi:hypothetical protein
LARGAWDRLKRLFGGAEPPASAPRRIDSALGRERGAPPEPLVLFGNLAASDGIGQVVATYSTLSCVLIPEPARLDAFCAEHDVAGLVAHSRPEHPGEAGAAIAILRRRRPGRPALYHAWDYHVERGARRALEYAADGLLMPAIDMNEMFAYLFAILGRSAERVAPPASVEEHHALLQQLAPSSPFWKLQDTIVSPYH